MFIEYWTGPVTAMGYVNKVSGWVYPWTTPSPLFSPTASMWLVPGTWKEVW